MGILTDAQTVDVIRYMGYGVRFATGAGVEYPSNEPIYSTTTYLGRSIDFVLANLTASQAAVVINQFWTPLQTLEAAIPAAGANLDTDQAAVWKHNANEVADRVVLYNTLRRALCHFLGFPPGPGIEGGSRTLARS